MSIKKLKKTAKAIGLAGILATSVLFSSCKEDVKVIPPPPLTRDGHYPGAIVFAYKDNPFPTEYIDNRCDPDSNKSFHEITRWYNAQSKRYGRNDEMPFACFETQEKVPDWFGITPGQDNGPLLDSLADHLREKIPYLNNYDFLGVIYQYPMEQSYLMTDSFGRVYRRVFLTSISPEMVYWGESEFLLFDSSHESMHFQGAKDKYNENGGGCEQGILPSDIMCGLNEDGTPVLFNQVQITPPTAREIGWIR